MQDKEPLVLNMLSLFESVFYKVKQECHGLTRDLNLADGQIILLMMLSKKDGRKATDIAGHIGITSGAVTGMTDKLESLGLIRRERSEEDRRVVRLFLTDEGRAAVQRIRIARFDKLKTIFLQLEENDLRDFIRILNTVHSIMEEKELTR